MSNQHLVITLLCDDKPGIVQQVAKTIADTGGNWLESRMSQLAGKFAGILLVSIPEDDVETLSNALNKLSEAGLQIMIDRAGVTPAAVQGRTLGFELIGADRIGIVSEIAQAFSEKGISIDDIETSCSSMPWSGEPLFEAKGVLIAPKNMNKEELMDKLYSIEDNLGVDIVLKEHF